MSDNNYEKVPRIKSLYFYPGLSFIGKVIFILSQVFILSLVLYFLVLYFQKTDPAFPLVAVEDLFKTIVPVQKFHINYRTTELLFPVFNVFTTFNAEMAKPGLSTSLLFLIGQLLGWILLLFSSLKMKGYISFIVYGFFMFYIVFSSIAEMVFGKDIYLLGSLFIGLLFIAPPFLMARKILKFSDGIILLYHLLLFILLLSLVYFKGGEVFLHRFSTGSLPLLFLLSSFIIVFSTRVFFEFLILVFTNSKKKESRMSLTYLIILLSLVFILLLFSSLSYFNILPHFKYFPEPFLIVILLLLVAAPVFQNGYVSIKNVFKGNSGFIALLNGLFIILISVLIYAILAGEKTIIFQFRTLTSICLPIIFFFQILYLYINFGKQLKERMPVFSILHLPTKIRFISVWFMLAFSVLLAEANWGWRGLAFIRTISDNAKADNGLLQNDIPYSISWYRNALKFTASDPKANFNLATLLIQNKGSLDSASAHLKQASSFFKDFWVSGLNHANLNLLFGNKVAATEILKEAILVNNSPWLFNNISYIFYKKNMPDSAIFFLKSSLNSSYRIPETFGNLALIYHRYGKPIEAGKFITLGLENEPKNENLAVNAISISLNQDTLLYTEEPDPEQIQTESLLNNYSLLALKKGDLTLTEKLTDISVSKNPGAEPLLVKIHLKFLQDSLLNSKTRAEYLNYAYPEYGSLAYHNLAVDYFNTEVPEMAAYYFQKSSTSGIGLDSLNYASAVIDKGDPENGYRLLNEVRAIVPDAWIPASKESAMLLRAFGQGQYAFTDWNFEDINIEECMRMTKYAALSGNRVEALEAARLGQAVDSSSILPYFEMGKIFSGLKDSLAFETFDLGLLKSPDNDSLLIAKAEALLNFGNPKEAKKICSKITITNDSLQLKRLKARILIAENNLKDASELLKSILKVNPLDKKSCILLGRIYLNQEKNTEAYRLFFEATEINFCNADLWFHFAEAALKLNMQKESGYGAIKAIEFSYTKEAKNLIQNSFKDQIKVYLDTQ